MSIAHDLRDEAERLTESLAKVKKALEQMERSCRHDWGQTVADPIYIEGRFVPESGGGVDRIREHHVPPQTTSRWKRTCKKCGKIEHTTRTDEKVTRVPKF